MPSWEPPVSCPFMRRLIIALSTEQPTSPNRQDRLLFSMLLALESDAERDGAPDTSRRTIARARRLAGKAMTTNYPPVIRGH